MGFFVQEHVAEARHHIRRLLDLRVATLKQASLPVTLSGQRQA